MSDLQESTLVLNSKWRAIGIDTIQESIKKITKLSCKFMNPYTYEVLSLEDWMNLDPNSESFVPIDEHPVIQSAKRSFVGPRVVILVNYADKPKAEVRLSRENVLTRDKKMCQYCGTKVSKTQSVVSSRKGEIYTWDHVVPRSMGGKTTWTNIVTCCFKCNSKKANRTMEQCGLRLLSEPSKPRWSLQYAKSLKKKPKCWDKFLTKDMWDSELVPTK